MTQLSPVVCYLFLFRLTVVVSPPTECSGSDMDRCPIAEGCSEFGRCSQTCSDSTGSVQCSCISGFRINPQDNTSCLLVDDNATIIYAGRSTEYVTKGEGVWALPFGKGRAGPKKFIHATRGTSPDVTYNARDDYIYWINYESIWRSRLDGTEKEVVVDKGLKKPDGIAYDWIGNNIYFSDSIYHRIVVCAGDFTSCCILIYIPESPRPANLALQPNQGLMFWADWGRHYKNITSSIFRAGMDGSDPVRIIRDNVRYPSGMAVDQGNNRIYWTDYSLNQIESARFDGTDRRVLLHYGASSPVGVDVLGDLIFWITMWNKEQIHISNKFNGSLRTILLKEKSEIEAYGIAAFHIANQPISRRNQCEDAGCSHICTLGPRDSFRCFCPVSMKLDTDDKICINKEIGIPDSDVPTFILGYDNIVKMIRADSIGRDVYDDYILEDFYELGAMVYNPVNKTVILSDIKSRKIVELDFKTKNLNVLVNDGLESVTGIDIDIVGENLYWVDSDKRTVEVMSLRTGARAVLLREIDRPTDIILIPDKQILIMSQLMDSGGGQIVKMSLTGSNRQVLIQSSNDFQPIVLHFNREFQHIFWTNQITSGIGYITLDGDRLDSDRDKKLSAYGITSYDSKIYWTDRHVQLLCREDRIFFRSCKYYFSKYYFGRYDQVPRNETAADGSYQKGNFSTRVTVVDNSVLETVENLTKVHPCSRKSDEGPICSHICLMSSVELMGTCRCPKGLVLDSDGRTCVRIGLHFVAIILGVILLIFTLVALFIVFVMNR